MRIYLIISIGLLLSLNSCGLGSEKLPYVGEPETTTKIVDGKTVTERDYPSIPDFSFTNQNGKVITQRDFAGKIYVADFFFVTCPTICPVMKRNMLKVYQAYQTTLDIRILSHSIDPDHDTPTILKQYAQELGITGTMWQFVTGDREKIYDIGENHYFVTTGQDAEAPGGLIHSGHFVLVDKEKHIRGMYDGTTDEGTQKLIRDIKTLQEEYE